MSKSQFVSSIYLFWCPVSLTLHLLLFHMKQYPVRPATMTYDDVSHLAAKIKPKQQRVRKHYPLILSSITSRMFVTFFAPPVTQVELEMAINTMSPNYCRSKGEQIALNVDGTTFDETNTYSTYVHCTHTEPGVTQRDSEFPQALKILESV